jgi:drug/metabolite transporter (DMT)-like permease
MTGFPWRCPAVERGRSSGSPRPSRWRGPRQRQLLRDLIDRELPRHSNSTASARRYAGYAIPESNICSHPARTEPANQRRPRLGYALAASAATLWALNGSLAEFLLQDHLPAARLSELRAVGTTLAVTTTLAIVNPKALKVRANDVPRLAILGVVGFAGVSLTYFAAIARIQIGVALTIQYLAPLLLMLYLKAVHRRQLPKGLYRIAALTATGCFFVVRAYSPGNLNGTGVAYALAAAITFALYLYMTEQAGQRYPPVTTLAYGFGFAAIFWLITQPPTTFHFHTAHEARDIACAIYVVVGGTLVPFLLMITAVRHLPAARAAIVATLEPVLGAILAWPIHDQTLQPGQIAGGAVVITAVIYIQTERSHHDAELAPSIE